MVAYFKLPVFTLLTIIFFSALPLSALESLPASTLQKPSIPNTKASHFQEILPKDIARLEEMADPERITDPELITDPERVTDPEAARSIFEELERRQNSITREKARMNMVITDTRGRTRNRSMVMWSSFGEQTERSLTVFDDPANVRGTAFLSLRVDEIRTQKLYLPAVGRIQTITSAERGDRFMGSDFTYEDLGDQNADEYEFLWLETHDDHYRIHASKPDSDQYTSLEFMIDRETYALREIFYFNEQSDAPADPKRDQPEKNQPVKPQPVKHLKAEDFRPITDIYVAPFRMTMVDLRENRNTMITWTERDTEAEVPDWRFTDRGLRRGL